MSGIRICAAAILFAAMGAGIGAWLGHEGLQNKEREWTEGRTQAGLVFVCDEERNCVMEEGPVTVKHTGPYEHPLGRGGVLAIGATMGAILLGGIGTLAAVMFIPGVFERPYSQAGA